MSGAERETRWRPLPAAYPRFLEAWASLAELAEDELESYAYARVGYHSGLDRATGRGLARLGLRALAARDEPRLPALVEALRRAAEAIGEIDEAQRCALFLSQLDPDWAR